MSGAQQPNSPEEWFKSLPPVTRCYLVSALTCTLATQFSICNPRLLVWDLTALKNFQIWRLVTPFTFFGGLGLSLVMQLVMLCQYSTRLEQDAYNTGGGGGSGDYLLMLIFGAAVLHIVNLYMQSYVLGPSLLAMITYVWSCRHSTAVVSFWGFTLQAMYLPWALAALSFLTSGTEGLIIQALGITVGHLYYFCIEILPLEYHVHLLKTPGILVQAVGAGGNDASRQPAGSASQMSPPSQRSGYFQGAGRTLGSQ